MWVASVGLLVRSFVLPFVNVSRCESWRYSLNSLGALGSGACKPGMRCKLHLLMIKCKFQEIFERQPAVARFVGMLPTRGVRMPVLERFFQMELNRIDH